MEYFWDYSSLEEALNKLSTIISQEKDLEKKAFLLRVYDNTRQMMFNDFISSCEEETMVNLSNGLICLSSEFYSNYTFYTFVESFHDVVLQYEEEIFGIEDTIEDKYGEVISTITGAKFSKDKTISMVGSFYHSFDKELEQVFLPIYSKRFTNLRFVDKCKNANGHEVDANNYFIGGINENFIESCNDETIETYHNLVHEYGHAIANMISPERPFYDDTDYLAELPSIFPEIVSMYEVNDENKLDSSFLAYALLVDYFNKAYILTLHKDVLEIWKKHGRVTNKEFFKEVKDLYGLEEKDINDLFDCSIYDDGVYVISYMVSLELFHIYKQDKEKALELYKKILSFKNAFDAWKFVYANGLIAKNLDEEVQDTIKSLKKKL